MHVQVKICGVTRPQDLEAIANLGADAVGVMFYPKSPRYVTIEQAAQLLCYVPPWLNVVGLFVNPSAAFVRSHIAALPLNTLQFHGNEEEAFCRSFQRPYVKAVRMQSAQDFLDHQRRFSSARALLADSFVPQYGGAGVAFNWDWLPKAQVRQQPLVLAGGLSADRVAEAIRKVRPAAVDVSSAVERLAGVKDIDKVKRFMDEVRHAALQLS